MKNCLLRVDQISQRFGGVHALKEVEFSMNQGDILGLIGPNGAGKTTLFNIITGIYHPTEGMVHFDGVDLTGWNPSDITASGIARTFQNIRLFGSLTSLENLLIASYLRFKTGLISAFLETSAHRQEKEQANRAGMELLQFVGLESKGGSRADSLPYGEQRKLEIARALATNPKLLLLDEPAAGLNQKETESLMELIRKIQIRGHSVLVIEHHMKLVMGVSDQVVVLDHGEKIADDSPERVQKNPQVIKAYLGSGDTHA